MKNTSYILIIFILTGIACGHSKTVESVEVAAPKKLMESQVELSDAQLRNADLGIGKISLQNIDAVLKVNGKIDLPPQCLVSVCFPLGGYLKSTPLITGMTVRKGQVIAELEDPNYIQLQEDYLTATAKMNFLQTELNRQRELSKENISAGKVLQQTQSDYQIQEIAVQALAQRLKILGVNPLNLTPQNIASTVTIHAPNDGIVTKINTHIGKYIHPTESIFEIILQGNMNAVLTVFEKDIPKLRIGQKIKISLPNQPDKIYTATILLIGTTINESHALEIICSFDKTTAINGLFPNMFINAEIITSEKNLMTLPNDAIVRFENKNFIFIVKSKNIFEMTEVELGASNKDISEVKPINSNDLLQKEIVIKNAYTILSKMKNTEEE